MGCGNIATKKDVREMLDSAGVEVDIEVLNIENFTNILNSPDEVKDAVADFVDSYEDSPEYVNAIVECINGIVDTKIPGIEEVISQITFDTTGNQAKGAEFQLAYISRHKGEIAEVEMPRVKFRKDDSAYGVAGIDIVNRDGSVVELKNYNLNSSCYNQPSVVERTVDKIVSQALDRVNNLGATHATTVFASWNGPIPAAYKAALDEAFSQDSRIDWKVE